MRRLQSAGAATSGAVLPGVTLTLRLGFTCALSTVLRSRILFLNLTHVGACRPVCEVRQVGYVDSSHDALARPAITATEDEELAGVLSHELGPIECEILTLYAAPRWAGVGSALVRAVADVATAARQGGEACRPPTGRR
jgi:GNAT superfamily N-acetyltransferase